ncbi:DNA-binding response regulator [Actinomycetota bacterium]|nr:DNA-binding response regulator [Actinomycetota bacterium]
MPDGTRRDEVASGGAGDVTVLVVDDQALVRAGLVTILDAQPGLTVVGDAGTGAEAVREATRLDPDVICMDVEMPDMDGLEATRRIVADPRLHAAILMLTTFNREDYLIEALRAGACGFLLKSSRPAHLVDAVRSAAAGDGLLAPEVTRAVIARAVAAGEGPRGGPGVGAGSGSGRATGDPAGSGAAEPAPRVPAQAAPERLAPDPEAAVRLLTEREVEVLHLVARGLTNDEIAAELVVGRATVKTHVSSILTKLALRDRVQAVVYAYEHGVVRQG